MRELDYTKPETLTNEDLAHLLTDETLIHRIKFGYTAGASVYRAIKRECAWRLTFNPDVVKRTESYE